MNSIFTTRNTDTVHAADTTNQDSAMVDLFAEELPEQHDHARIPGICCASTLSSAGGCFSSLGSLSTTC